LGVPINYGGYPKMVAFIMESPVKMDDLGVPIGTPISGNLHFMTSRVTGVSINQPFNKVYPIILVGGFNHVEKY